MRLLGIGLVAVGLASAALFIGTGAAPWSALLAHSAPSAEVEAPAPALDSPAPAEQPSPEVTPAGDLDAAPAGTPVPLAASEGLAADPAVAPADDDDLGEPGGGQIAPDRPVIPFSPPAEPAAATAGRPRTRGIPILMYHYIRTNPVPSDRLGFGLSVTPAAFEEQMSFLESRGWRTIPMRGLTSALSRPANDKEIAITLDDGYADAFSAAYPVLQRHGFVATFYIITDAVGRPGYLGWPQILALQDAGMDIGSHTVTHRDLTRLGPLAVLRELADSRASLQRHLGRSVTEFCYPSGKYSRHVRLAAAEAGYQTAVTTRPGSALASSDAFELPRVRVGGGMTLAGFAAALGEPPPNEPLERPASRFGQQAW